MTLIATTEQNISYWIKCSVDDRARLYGISPGETISDDGYGWPYQPDPNLYFCHALVMKEGRWWLVNSSWSAEGTIDITRVKKN